MIRFRYLIVAMAVALVTTASLAVPRYVPKARAATTVAATQIAQTDGRDQSKRTEPLKFKPNVPIPGLFDSEVSVDEGTFGSYVVAFYIYFSGVAGILAIIVMMWGGFHYITSAGNPQRMNQGKEIISNAVIGLILVLTSYLLLRTINPQLLILRIPGVGYVAQQLNTAKYCQAQGANAIAAAAGKYCGTEVTYKDAEGKTKKCITLDIPADHKTVEADKQTACFPFATMVIENNQKVAAISYQEVNARTLCEDNKYTDDTACAGTQALFRLQRWLKGACVRADVSLASDRCLYNTTFSCQSGETRVDCNVGGVTRETPCWESGHAAVSDPYEGVRAHCVDPAAVPQPSARVEGACCRVNQPKSEITCSSDGPKRDEANIDCGPYQAMSGKFKCRGLFCTPPETCSTLCFAKLRLRMSSDPLDYEQ